MKSQMKLFAANLALAAATFTFVGTVQANAQAPATSSATASVVQYLNMVGQQSNEVLSPINEI